MDAKKARIGVRPTKKSERVHKQEAIRMLKQKMTKVARGYEDSVR